MGIAISWSSGKDSAWTLHTLRNQAPDSVACLVTAVTDTFDRVSVHGVRRTLLATQAAAAECELREVVLPHPCSNEDYQSAMKRALARLASEGITHMAFGDLFLEDVRRYREELLSHSGIEPIFPLWDRDTSELAREMVAGGLRATVTVIDPARLGREWAGRSFDRAFLDQLPEGVDPCGERGEFHTVATAGPMFRRVIPTRSGPTVERDGFVYTDVMEQSA